MPAAVRAAARDAALVWLCDPNNPTGLPEPDGAIADLLAGLLADADGRRAGRPGRRPRRGLCRVRRPVARRAARRLPAPGRGADGLEGLRPRRAAGRVRDRPARADRGDRAVPSAGLGRDPLGGGRRRRPARPRCPCRERRPRRRASAPAWPPRFAAAGFPAAPVGHELPARRPRRPAEPPGPWPTGSSPAASSPGRSAPDHPLAGHLRFTVRDEAAGRPPDRRVRRARPDGPRRRRRHPATAEEPTP